MLVLNRRKNEVICIGDDIKICIIDVRHGKVSLGIEAPNSIPVHREEVYEAIKKQNDKQTTDQELPGSQETQS